MTTATPTRTLADELHARWEAAQDDIQRYDVGASGDPIADALTTFYLALSEPWYIAVTKGIDSVPLAGEWDEVTEAQVIAAGRQAFEAHVVPAMIATVVERMKEYPEWVAAHPKGEQLRADLALLEADR